MRSLSTKRVYRCCCWAARLFKVSHFALLYLGDKIGKTWVIIQKKYVCSVLRHVTVYMSCSAPHGGKSVVFLAT